MLLRLAMAFLMLAVTAAFLGFRLPAACSWAAARIRSCVVLVLAVLNFRAGKCRQLSSWE